MVFLTQMDILVCAKNKIIARRMFPGQKIYQKCFNGWGSAPEPAGELTALPRLIAGFQGREDGEVNGRQERSRKRGELKKGKD